MRPSDPHPLLPAPVAVFGRWGAFWGAMLLVAALAGFANGLGRVDLSLTDQIAALDTRAVSPQVLIVAIDEPSLAALGRWPWRRAVHAALIGQLSTQGVRAVGLNLLFTDADPAHPGDDARLAHALRANGAVVLPLYARWPDGLRAEPALPVPVLREAAHGLGHIHLELDSDGVARSVFLREGTMAQRWDHWALALLAAGGEPVDPARLPGLRRSAPPPDDPAVWRRDHQVLIPFAGPPGQVERVSYIDVLEGRVPRERLQGRYVLVGATAASLGNGYATPMASRDSLMPGVEAVAQLVDALHQGVYRRAALPWENALFSALPVLLAALALTHWPPRRAPWSLLGLVLLVGLSAWLLRRGAGVQVAPLAALLSLALVYPLWAWFRIDAVIRYLGHEFRQAQRGMGVFAPRPAAPRARGDALDRQMHAMAGGLEQLRALQRLVHDGLDALSDPVLVLDAQGRVQLVNPAAARYFGTEAQALQNETLHERLASRLTLPDRSPLPDLRAALQGQGGVWHVMDAQGRDLMLKCHPRLSPPGRPEGSIVSLVDFTSVQEVQRQREEALRFLSHDMRAPPSAILTLIEIDRLEPGADPQLLRRIEAHARRALALADDFVQLARAQSDASESEVVDLRDVLIDAADHHWDQARAASVEILTDTPPEPAWCRGDRDLLTRAVGNLIDNALKYGPRDAQVRCRLLREGDHHVISVIDQGVVIAPEERAGLFEPFKRLGRESRTRGAGLGLAFVQAAMARHHGSAQASAAPGGGNEFRLQLPAHDDA
jgi:CHASE2 domain-containing sensor protein/signal transduction histidine kinase